MSDKKQTAVNWLIDRLTERYVSDITPEEWFGIKWQAKQMEREQIEDAFAESRLTHPMAGFKHDTFNEYYDQTYGE